MVALLVGMGAAWTQQWEDGMEAWGEAADGEVMVCFPLDQRDRTTGSPNHRHASFTE